ncbi:alpha/beta hydrolase [Flavitalea sp.]|nr:alpha/beta hydrolase [Flavitalea sp.]
MIEDKRPKVLFLHSAGPQHDEEGSAKLIKYIKDNLSTDYQIIAPIMPHPEDPDYKSWKLFLKEIFKIMDDDMILIGHSLGGSVLLKFLSEEKPPQRIKSLYLVAVPFWGLEDWEVDEFQLTEDFAENLPPIPSINIYHSKDDEIVSPHHAERYAAELPGAVYHELNGYGHVYWKGLPGLITHIRENQ